VNKAFAEPTPGGGMSNYSVPESEEVKKDESFKVIEGYDGVDIIKFIIDDQMNNNKIKCVITDENMEFINGSVAIKILKDLEKERKIKPIIFASNTVHDNQEIKDNLRNSGIDYFIPKMCKEKEILTFFNLYKILENEEDV
jgi:response regulator RpfG family c-di-GMP phosphodiesterase